MKNKYTMPRRGIWYILRAVVIILVVILLAYGIFAMAMNIANLYILANEGFTYRISCILGNGDPNELYAYFTQDCIDNDALLSNNIYQLYTISSYDYRLSIVGIDVMPWYTTATMEVIERIPSIVGTANLGSPTAAVPLWEAGRYRLTFINKDSRWIIDKIDLLEANPAENQNPTPNMDLLPSSTIMPKPSYTQKPTFVPPTLPQATGAVSPAPSPTKS
ncbi:MAG: hypothetical protein RRY79_04105 [Clostridia bacterium]